MPSKTPKQAKTMRAAAHNPEFAKKVGIPQNVAKDYARADQRPAAAKYAAADKGKAIRRGTPRRR